MAVGWYLRFSLSYRDVEELVRQRGLSVDHVTAWRWVQRYAPEIDRRLRPHLKPTNKSWRVDETWKPSVTCHFLRPGGVGDSAFESLTGTLSLTDV